MSEGYRCYAKNQPRSVQPFPQNSDLRQTDERTQSYHGIARVKNVWKYFSNTVYNSRHTEHARDRLQTALLGFMIHLFSTVHIL